MEIVIRAAGAAVVGSILALLLKKYTPELSVMLSLITGGFIIWISARVASEVTDTLLRLAENGGIGAVYLSPVMKCIGIGMITHLSSQLCRDSQQGSVASAVELCGTLCAVYIAMPLINSLLATMEKLL